MMVCHSYVECVFRVVLSAYLAKSLHGSWIVFDVDASHIP